VISHLGYVALCKRGKEKKGKENKYSAKSVQLNLKMESRQIYSVSWGDPTCYIAKDDYFPPLPAR